MPIQVICPGCHARFAVSDKFAGKEGPCPKCKKTIRVPAASEVVKVHVPEEFASGGKDSRGRAATKPIARRDTKLTPVTITGVSAVVLVVVAVACLSRGLPAPGKTAVIVLGLAALSPPIAAAGYTFLRDDELEPYRGLGLWTRAGICAAVYALLWAAYLPLSNYMTGEPYQWLFVAPVFIAVGALAAYAALDLDFFSGALHYCFYLLLTLLLRFAMGLPPVWSSVAR